MDDQQTWEGFTSPEKGFFKVPNNFVEALARIDNMAELKVILYVMRHTWGFQEYGEAKKITLDEFVNGRKLKNRERMDSGTGLGLTTVRDGLAKALKHGYLECEVDDSDLGRIKKSYRLKMKDDSDETQPQDIEQPAPEKKTKKGKNRLQELQTMPYPEYLQTPEWAAKRAKALRFASYRCQMCNANADLTVHHRTYERKGHELLNDLIVLCKDCHDTFTFNRELAE